MEIPIYQIDAFAEKLFEGNTAAVCPLKKWLPTEKMQAIAKENNLSETAFFVPEGDNYSIRWFSPVTEVNLCGHATLATAFVLFNYLGYQKDKIIFSSKSGMLSVQKDKNRLVMDFPAQSPVYCDTPKEILQAFEKIPTECLISEDYIVVFDNEMDIRMAKPDFDELKKLDLRGVIITAKSKNYDFVARFFAPSLGINEDPVTGSAYTQLAPYWAKKLGKNKFCVKQLSKRGGKLGCEIMGDRVKISGSAVKFMQGTISI